MSGWRNSYRTTDAFTEASPHYRRARSLGASPMPITALEVAEYPPTVGRALRTFLGGLGFFALLGGVCAWVWWNL